MAPRNRSLALDADPSPNPFTEQVAAPADAEAPPPVPELGTGAPSDPIPLAPSSEPGLGAPPAKRKHQRRTKAQMAADAAAEVSQGPPPVSEEDLARTVAAFAVTFRALSGALAKRRGEHWLLTDEETGTLGQAWANAVAPYLHKVGPAVPWISAAVITWSVFQPRIEADAKKKELAAGTPAAQ